MTILPLLKWLIHGSRKERDIVSAKPSWQVRGWKPMEKLLQTLRSNAKEEWSGGLKESAMNRLWWSTFFETKCFILITQGIWWIFLRKFIRNNHRQSDCVDIYFLTYYLIIIIAITEMLAFIYKLFESLCQLYRLWGRKDDGCEIFISSGCPFFYHWRFFGGKLPWWRRSTPSFKQTVSKSGT